MKRLRIGQSVRVADPCRIAARFWNADRGYIVGAGGAPVPRDLLDRPAIVGALMGNGRTATRGLVVFDAANDVGMWLDADTLAPAPRAE